MEATLEAAWDTLMEILWWMARTRWGNLFVKFGVISTMKPLLSMRWTRSPRMMIWSTSLSISCLSMIPAIKDVFLFFSTSKGLTVTETFWRTPMKQDWCLRGQHGLNSWRAVDCSTCAIAVYRTNVSSNWGGPWFWMTRPMWSQMGWSWLSFMNKRTM